MPTYQHGISYSLYFFIGHTKWVQSSINVWNTSEPLFAPPKWSSTTLLPHINGTETDRPDKFGWDSFPPRVISNVYLLLPAFVRVDPPFVGFMSLSRKYGMLNVTSIKPRTTIYTILGLPITLLFSPLWKFKYDINIFVREEVYSYTTNYCFRTTHTTFFHAGSVYGYTDFIM